MSTIILRDYQKNLIESALDAWDSDLRNVLIQSHTGSGKTVMLTHIVEHVNVPTVIVAHRIELVSQLSLALARAEIPHGLLSSAASIPDIIKLHLQMGRKHYFSPTAQVIVASVDTLIRRTPQWAARIKLVVIDEAAHVLRANKWGKAMEMFPNAKGLLVTATPLRADGKGLGREAEGIADILIEGPSMRQLIDEGYLSRYRIFAPPNSLDLTPVKVTASGDYSPDPLRKAVARASITGDVVEHFKRHAGGLGITFAVSVEAAQELAVAYSNAGVPAVCLHAGTGISERASIMRRFREGTIQQLVNVDILAEGVDVPAVSCVSMARPTASYGLYMQQIGRALRPAEGKTHAVILDHVGNVMKHGLPETTRTWTLAAQERKGKGVSGMIPLRTCLNPICVAVFERNRDRCPYCGHPIPEPKERATPAQVEGNLLELTPSTYKEIEKEISRIDSAPRIPRGVSGIVSTSIVKKHHARQDAIRNLRIAISEWAGEWHTKGESDSEIHRRFWFTFGIDILTAQTLNTKEALQLLEKLNPEQKQKLSGLLTDEIILSATSKKERYRIADGNSLYLIVEATGAKGWKFRYRIDGKEKAITLGKYPEISLNKARNLRYEIKKMTDVGQDPRKEFLVSLVPLYNKNKLTDQKILDAKPKDRRYKISDGNQLFLIVQPTGSKYWSINYVLQTLRTSKYIGPYPQVSLEKAREVRDECLRLLKQGIDPKDFIDKMRT
jgi:superfamily II DNA or RNA helicase